MSLETNLRKKLHRYSLRLDEIRDGLKYLKEYGYIDSILCSRMSVLDIYEAVNKFQELAGLVMDGEMGPKTMRAMTWPRCACPDYHDQHGLRMEVLFSKWRNKNLTYFIEKRDDDLAANEWDSIIRLAFQQWADVADLHFTEVYAKTNANFVMSVGSGPRDKFDGPGGTLAYAYLPPNDSFDGQLRCFFDSSETWIIDITQRGILLLNVATHEIGHLLGLGHSQIRTALMAPFYAQNVTKPVPIDDYSRIIALYGKATGTPDPDPTPVPPLTFPVPTDLTAVAGDNGVGLNWKDNSTGEDFFEVERNGVIVGKVRRGQTGALDTGVLTGTHKYRVRATADGGKRRSAWSSEASVTLGDVGPEEPTDGIVITLSGKIEDINIPGYRVTKLG